MLTEQRKYILLKGNILKRMEYEGVSDKQMAAATGMATDTFRKKKLHPERFTYPEVLRIFKRLDFPDEEILEAIR